jgi:hypothetical protein
MVQQCLNVIGQNHTTDSLVAADPTRTNQVDHSVHVAALGQEIKHQRNLPVPRLPISTTTIKCLLNYELPDPERQVAIIRGLVTLASQ